MGKKLKRINIHDDYPLYLLWNLVGVALGAAIAYAQDKTPYGAAYKAMIEKGNEIYALFDEMSHALQECVEARLEKEG